MPLPKIRWLCVVSVTFVYLQSCKMHRQINWANLTLTSVWGVDLHFFKRCWYEKGLHYKILLGTVHHFELGFVIIMSIFSLSNKLHHTAFRCISFQALSIILGSKRGPKWWFVGRNKLCRYGKSCKVNPCHSGRCIICACHCPSASGSRLQVKRFELETLVHQSVITTFKYYDSSLHFSLPAYEKYG